VEPPVAARSESPQPDSSIAVTTPRSLGAGGAEHVEDLLRRTAFPAPGTPVNCAVSGGADSLALVVLAVSAGCVATAIHVDHGLRTGSASEADAVRDAATRFGAQFESRTARVDPGGDLEARARRARYDALPAGVLTGHTMDDQAETVLLNMIRGTGLHGIGAMRPSARKPLLAIRRAETAALCVALGLEPLVDPSNTDPTFRRNRVRHEVLPLLSDVAERDVVPILARTAALARGATDHLDELAMGIDPTDAGGLADSPPVLAALAIRTWLRAVAPDLHPPDAATIARVRRVAAGGAVATDVGGGWEVRRHAGRLLLRQV